MSLSYSSLWDLIDLDVKTGQGWVFSDFFSFFFLFFNVKWNRSSLGTTSTSSGQFIRTPSLAHTQKFVRKFSSSRKFPCAFWTCTNYMEGFPQFGHEGE